MSGLELLTLENFTPLVGTEFVLTTSDFPMALMLKEAAPSGPNSVKGRPFSLLFHGPALPALPQGTYSLTHINLGRTDIFLVPISSTGEQRVYEAIFA